MSNWFEYLDRRTAPPPNQRKRIVRHVAPVPRPRSCEGMLVEESTASDSMIQRIIGKLRG